MYHNFEKQVFIFIEESFIPLYSQFSKYVTFVDIPLHSV